MVPEEEMEALASCKDLMDKNFSKMRSELQQQSFNVIPYLGAFQRDLVYLEESPTFRGDHINLQKLRSISAVILNCVQYQNSSYNWFQEIPVVQKIIQNYECLTEEQAHEVSLKLEPREKTGDNKDDETASPLAPVASPLSGHMDKRLSKLTYLNTSKDLSSVVKNSNSSKAAKLLGVDTLKKGAEDSMHPGLKRLEANKIDHCQECDEDSLPGSYYFVKAEHEKKFICDGCLNQRSFECSPRSTPSSPRAGAKANSVEPSPQHSPVLQRGFRAKPVDTTTVSETAAKETPVITVSSSDLPKAAGWNSTSPSDDTKRDSIRNKELPTPPKSPKRDLPPKPVRKVTVGISKSHHGLPQLRPAAAFRAQAASGAQKRSSVSLASPREGEEGEDSNSISPNISPRGTRRPPPPVLQRGSKHE